MHCWRSSMVEPWFCKPVVVGSSPIASSIAHSSRAPRSAFFVGVLHTCRVGVYADTDAGTHTTTVSVTARAASTRTAKARASSAAAGAPKKGNSPNERRDNTYADAGRRACSNCVAFVCVWRNISHVQICVTRCSASNYGGNMREIRPAGWKRLTRSKMRRNISFAQERIRVNTSRALWLRYTRKSVEFVVVCKSRHTASLFLRCL